MRHHVCKPHISSIPSPLPLLPAAAAIPSPLRNGHRGAVRGISFPLHHRHTAPLPSRCGDMMLALPTPSNPPPPTSHLPPPPATATATALLPSRRLLDRVSILVRLDRKGQERFRSRAARVLVRAALRVARPSRPGASTYARHCSLPPPRLAPPRPASVFVVQGV